MPTSPSWQDAVIRIANDDPAPAVDGMPEVAPDVWRDAWHACSRYAVKRREEEHAAGRAWCCVHCDATGVIGKQAELVDLCDETFADRDTRYRIADGLRVMAERVGRKDYIGQRLMLVTLGFLTPEGERGDAVAEHEPAQAAP